MARIVCPAVAVTSAVRQTRRSPSPRNVHVLRVALARLRVWLRLAGHGELESDARWLRRAAQPLRDLDVRLELRPPPALRRTLEAKRRGARRELAQTLADERTAALVTALPALEPLKRAKARRGLSRLARRVRREIEAAEASPHSLEALHTLRRGVRNLRFALEALGVDATREVKLQSALGDFCDRAVALDFGASGDWRDQLQQQQRKAARKALKRWRKLEPRFKRME